METKEMTLTEQIAYETKRLGANEGLLEQIKARLRRHVSGFASWAVSLLSVYPNLDEDAAYLAEEALYRLGQVGMIEEGEALSEYILALWKKKVKAGKIPDTLRARLAFYVQLDPPAQVAVVVPEAVVQNKPALPQPVADREETPAQEHREDDVDPARTLDERFMNRAARRAAKAKAQLKVSTKDGVTLPARVEPANDQLSTALQTAIAPHAPAAPDAKPVETTIEKFRRIISDPSGRGGDYWQACREIVKEAFSGKSISEKDDWKLLISKMKTSLFFTDAVTSKLFFEQCPPAGIADLTLGDSLWNMVNSILKEKYRNPGSYYQLRFIIDCCLAVGDEANTLLDRCKDAVTRMKAKGFIDRQDPLVIKVAELNALHALPKKPSVAETDLKLDVKQELAQAMVAAEAATVPAEGVQAAAPEAGAPVEPAVPTSEAAPDFTPPKSQTDTETAPAETAGVPSTDINIEKMSDDQLEALTRPETVTTEPSNGHPPLNLYLLVDQFEGRRVVEQITTAAV